MDKSQKIYRLELSESFYLYSKKKINTHVDYIDFNLNGRFECKGSDEVGNFEIKGKFNKNLIKFKKNYIGKHRVFYLGKFEKNKINMFYYFEKNEKEDIKSKLKEGLFNSVIVFKSQAYEYKDNEVENDKNIILLSNDEESKCDNQSGLLFDKNGIFEVKINSNDNNPFDNCPTETIKNSIIEVIDEHGNSKWMYMEVNMNDCKIFKMGNYKEE